MAAKTKKPTEQAPKPKGKRKRKPQRTHSRKVPLILQKRRVKEEQDDGTWIEVEVTVGELIVRAVKIGAYKAQAAEAAGVSEAVLYKWLNRGEDALALAVEKVEETEEITPQLIPEAERPYVEFVESLKTAEAGAEIWHLGNIRRHAQKQWTASAWYLERTKRDRYGRGERDGGNTVPTLFEMQMAVDAAKKK